MKPIGYIKLICLTLVILGLTISTASAYTKDFPKHYNLWQGSAAMHEIGVYGNCDTLISIVSPYESSFDLYAVRNYGSYGSCPSNLEIMNNYDKVSYSNRGRATLVLEQGLWCVVVHARSGSGSVYVTANTDCTKPGPIPTPVPYPTPCSPYKINEQSGYLNQGQAAVYGYSIPRDGRSLIDWKVTVEGLCGDVPIIMSSTDNQMISRSSPYTHSSCGNVFDMYVHKDCNPRYSYCTTNYYANSPNNFISIANPTPGSIYYVMVYARNGSGTYNLRMNSYKCYQQTPIIIAASSDIQASAITGDFGIGNMMSVDTGDISEIAAPSAEFIQVSAE